VFNFYGIALRCAHAEGVYFACFGYLEEYDVEGFDFVVESDEKPPILPLFVSCFSIPEPHSNL